MESKNVVCGIDVYHYIKIRDNGAWRVIMWSVVLMFIINLMVGDDLN